MTDFEKKLILEKFDKEEDIEKAFSLLSSGVPLGYILGEWYFYGLTFKLNDACLMPRPDTEHLVDTALDILKNRSGAEGARILDLCTGCGCILLSILKNSPEAVGYGIDISERALERAKENAALLDIGKRAGFMRGDVLSGECFPEKTFDIITANPPYIPTKDISSLRGAVRKEPLIALDGGRDGADFYRSIKKHYLNLLQDEGTLILEIGYNQKKTILSIFPEAEIKKDYGGNDRVAIINKTNIA